MSLPKHYFRMISKFGEDGFVRLQLEQAPLPKLSEDQLLIQVEAAPINPSDLGLMLGMADVNQAKTSGNGFETELSIPVPETARRLMQARAGQALPVGNEGAGTVIAASDSGAAQAMIGKNVAALGGNMYAQYCAAPLAMCLELPEGADIRDGASSFVNPLTALGFLETMKAEGHKALVHSAAASNLGIMLNRLCQKDGVALVNIVRREEQEKQLRALGARYVVNSSDKDYMPNLIEAVHKTGATLGFDAVGGGSLASDMLTAMEAAAARTPGAYSIYGSTQHKQVYIYGSLDFSPSMLSRSYGMAWGVGGWLLPNFLAKAGMETAIKMRQRVASELTSTFASNYSDEISLTEALQADIAQKYAAKRTGEKFLIRPQQN